MTAKELLRLHPGTRCGYEPHSISTTCLVPEDCGFLRRLLRIPPKIAAYFCRAKIADVWKTRYGSEDCAYYIVRATDGTMFYIDY